MLRFTEKSRKMLRTMSPQELKTELEKHEKLLLEKISDEYLSIITKCKSIKTYEVSTNVSLLKEIAYKIMTSEDALRENALALRKAEKVIQKTSLLLRIIRALHVEGKDLYVRMRDLIFVKREKEAFKHNTFYGPIEKAYKAKLLDLSKAVELEIGKWPEHVVANSERIGREALNIVGSHCVDEEPVIFSKIYEIRPLLGLRKVLVPLSVARVLDFPVEMFPDAYSTDSEALSFALGFLFLKEKKLVEDGDFSFRGLDTQKVRLVRRLFEVMGSDCSEIQEEERKRDTAILTSNKGLLEEEGVRGYVETCGDVCCRGEQASIIDTFMCGRLRSLSHDSDGVTECMASFNIDGCGSGASTRRGLVETVEKCREDLAYLKAKDPVFSFYKWECESSVEEAAKKIDMSVFLSKKKVICEMAGTERLSLRIIEELRGVSGRVAEMLGSVIRDKYKQEIAGDEKTRRRVKGDALTVVKYYKDNGLPYAVFEGLVE